MKKVFPIAVYVHLGSNIPKHLALNLARHKSLFPNQRVFLITDQFVEVGILDDIETYIVDSNKLEKELFENMSNHLDFKFRHGFWKYTLQRFFALSEFHKEVSDSKIVHIESDVVVMPNFPWDKFERLNKVAWLKVNKNVDVAAIVFLPDALSSKNLSNEISRLATINPQINDMQALHECAKMKSIQHEYLPSLTSETARSTELMNASDQELISYFGGVFDPLILGLWNFGQDPKNSFGFRRRFLDDPNHDLNPEKSMLSYSDGMLFDQNGTCVFALHVHSKDLALFGIGWENALKSGLKQSARKSKRITFHMRALVETFQDRRLRENIWIILGLIPGIKVFRRSEYIESIKDKLKSFLRI